MLTLHQNTTMLQSLKARKLQLDRAIRELEAYAITSGLEVPANPPRRLRIVPALEDSHKQWLQ
jgi:hypothetical protein